MKDILPSICFWWYAAEPVASPWRLKVKKSRSSGFRPGKFFGGATFLSKPTEYRVSTEAVNNNRVLIWNRSTIRSLCVRYPRLLENALLIAYDYFVVYRSLLISATCQTARQRLAQALGNLANGIGRKVTEGIEINIRNEELANEANITIFTTSRLLNEWQRKGVLTKSRGKVVVRSPEGLMLSEDWAQLPFLVPLHGVVLHCPWATIQSALSVILKSNQFERQLWR
jgi:CRP-like cAMP-binding protein